VDTPALSTPLTLFMVDDNLVDVSLMRWGLDAHAAPWISLLEHGCYRVEYGAVCRSASVRMEYF
jgi:hypothetical protein